MERIVKKYSDFIDEDLNFTRYDNGLIRLEDRWFFYNPEDDIIFGCDDKPVGDDKMFSFNPTSCTFIAGGEEKQYDINNPILLIAYDLEKDEVKAYTEDAQEYLNSIGWKGDKIDIESQQCRSSLADFFEDNDDTRFILLYGDQMVASTFDVIEEN